MTALEDPARTEDVPLAPTHQTREAAPSTGTGRARALDGAWSRAGPEGTGHRATCLGLRSVLSLSRPQQCEPVLRQLPRDTQGWGHASPPGTRPQRTGPRLTFSTWRRTCGQRRRPCALPRHSRTAAPSSRAGSHRPAAEGHSGPAVSASRTPTAPIAAARSRGDFVAAFPADGRTSEPSSSAQRSSAFPPDARRPSRPMHQGEREALVPLSLQVTGTQLRDETAHAMPGTQSGSRRPAGPRSGRVQQRLTVPAGREPTASSEGVGRDTDNPSHRNVHTPAQGGASARVPRLFLQHGTKRTPAGPTCTEKNADAPTVNQRTRKSAL